MVNAIIIILCKEWEEEVATHSSILAWRIPWIEEPGGYSPWGCKESGTTERLILSLTDEKIKTLKSQPLVAIH